MTTRALSATDATWLLVESGDMPMHVGLLLEFSLPEDAPADFMTQLRASLHAEVELPAPWNLVPVHSPAGALPIVREAAEIDLEHHVRWWGLPEPGDQRELGVLVSHLHTQQLDLRRPLWEFHVIEGLGAGGFAVFVKVHHSVIDGASAMLLLTKALTTDPDERGLPPLFRVPAEDQADGQPSMNPLAAFLASVGRSLGAVQGFAQAGAGLAKASVSDSSLSVPFLHPKTALGARINGQRRLATQQYDLNQVKALSKATGTTVNDIVLYLSSTALRAYLSEIGKLPDSTLTAAIPVNIRREGDRSARTMAAMMIADLATNISDPLERLTAIKASTAAAKEHFPESPDAATAYALSIATPWVASLLAGGRSRAPQSLGISNVPGPREPLYWNGARLDALYPMSLLFHGNALNVTCVSYAGKLNFGFTGARDSLPHLQHLATAMGGALEELATIVLPGD